MAEDRTLGEIARALDLVVTRFENLANALDTKYVRRDLFDASQLLHATELAVLKGRVTDLEDGRKWLSRLVLGFIVLAVLGAVFTVAKAGGA